jgi:hypothetical protein
MKLLLASLLVLIPFTVQAEYLGDLSANELDPNSIANPFGAGSPFSPNSVTNEFGIYGNPYSNQSATNPYATEAPRLYDQKGTYFGTPNCAGASPPLLRRWTEDAARFLQRLCGAIHDSGVEILVLGAIATTCSPQSRTSWQLVRVLVQQGGRGSLGPLS